MAASSGRKDMPSRPLDVCLPRRPVDRPSPLYERPDEGRRFNFGEVVGGVGFTGDKFTLAKMARQPIARPCGCVLMGIEMLDQLQCTEAVAIPAEIVKLPVAVDHEAAAIGAEARIAVGVGDRRPARFRGDIEHERIKSGVFGG